MFSIHFQGIKSFFVKICPDCNKKNQWPRGVLSKLKGEHPCRSVLPIKLSGVEVNTNVRTINNFWGVSTSFEFCAIFHFTTNFFNSWKIQVSKTLEGAAASQACGKTSWNSSKVIDSSNISIDLDTRDGVLSVINCERFSLFQLFTHYNTTLDTIHTIYYRNGKTTIFQRSFRSPRNRLPKTSLL